MAGKGIEIPLAVNANGVVQGARDAEKALDGVADSLDELTRATGKGADTAADKLADSFKDAQKDVRTSAEKMEDHIRELGKRAGKSADQIEDDFRAAAAGVYRSGRKIGDDLGDSVKRGADKAGEGLDEFKDEAVSTGKEAAASFGSVEDALDAIQELAANALAGFGPAGIVAGAAVAVGLGLAISAGQDAAEAINEAKERVGELATELYDVGGDIDKIDLGEKMREWGVEIADSKEFWEIWQEGAVTNLEKAGKAADEFGLDFVDMFRGMSGYDAKAAKRALEDVRQEIEKNLAAQRKVGEWNLFENFEADKQLQELYKIEKQLESTADVTGSAAKANELLAEATDKETRAAEAAAAAEEARAEAISALQGEIDSAVEGFEEFKNAETGALDPAGYIASIGERIAATSNFNQNVQGLATQFGLTDEEIQTILDQGLDFAPMLQSIIDSGLAPEFISQIQAASDGGQDILDNNPLESTVDVDVAPADKTIRQLMEEDRATDPIETKVDVKAAEDALAKVASNRRTATIDAVAYTAAAERALSSLANRTRTATIYARVVDSRTGRPVV